METPETPAYARSLIASRRYVEAYELLYCLLDAVIDPDNCARELTWICEYWDRVEEKNALRLNYGPAGIEQLALFDFDFATGPAMWLGCGGYLADLRRRISDDNGK